MLQTDPSHQTKLKIRKKIVTKKSESNKCVIENEESGTDNNWYSSKVIVTNDIGNETCEIKTIKGEDDNLKHDKIKEDATIEGEGDMNDNLFLTGDKLESDTTKGKKGKTIDDNLCCTENYHNHTSPLTTPRKADGPQIAQSLNTTKTKSPTFKIKRKKREAVGASS